MTRPTWYSEDGVKAPSSSTSSVWATSTAIMRWATCGKAIIAHQTGRDHTDAISDGIFYCLRRMPVTFRLDVRTWIDIHKKRVYICVLYRR